MKNNLLLRSSEQGYFLVIAIIFILAMGVMGSLVAYLFSHRAERSVSEWNGLRTFYITESGLEIGARLLTQPSLSDTPSRLACGSVTGNSSITNASMGSGTFTVTTINSSPVFANTALNAGLTSGAASIGVSSTSGFAPSGKILIDREAIDYAALSGDTFVGVTRGVSGTLASSHANGTGVSQYQCSLDVQGGIPSIASPNYQRDLRWDVQLQEGWFVGNSTGSNFMFSHWNRPAELTWTLSNVAGGSSTTNLHAVDMLSGADGWAVGNEDGNNFTFLHWNGSAWQLAALSGACNGQNLQGVSMVSSQEGWAVGERYRPLCLPAIPFRYTVMRYDGSSWSLLTPTTSPSIPADASTNQNLNAVHVIDTNGDGLGNIGFSVGNNGTIFQYNGSNWVALSSPTTRDLNGVYTVSASEAWAVGNNGVILKWNGSSFSSFSSPVSSQLNAIAMLDTDGDGAANLGFAVGNSSVVLSYDGSSWSSTDLGSPNFSGVDIFNANDAWLVGTGGVIYHWDGSEWSSMSSGTTRALNGISLIAPKKNPTSAWQQVFH